jgi:NTE family protein
MLLVDGGVIRSIPIPVSAEEKNHEIIAVDIQPSLRMRSPLKNPLDVIYRVDDITTYHLNSFYLEQAETVIEPPVRDVKWDDFSNIGKLIAAGEKAARETFQGK